MIHFMIKNAITTGVILKQLKKKVNKMLYPYIAEFDMKSAKKTGFGNVALILNIQWLR